MTISFSSPVNRDARARGAGVTAVLGPTNTGKTHLAIERMLAHSSGIIGLPLRLLAREVYNKIVERIGPESVALITGEEKIKPYNPRFWVSTVEAMPLDLDVAFVAIDEIQLGADLERGHVFTDRMLHRRGRDETLVLGAQTVRPMVERLLPGAHVLTRPRLSQLTFAGEKKITRLPRRSAIVAFSADEVYSIAELIKRQRGGAAVVLGALSPRTRNAQVALYQNGDVDYLIATDAIGMGLNLDVDHVAFASDRKFDGYQFRRLNTVEFAQIAGRAGRATRDGTFGTTGRCPPFEPELVQALESHSFEPLKVLQWRNTDLDFFSVGALQASLAEVPKESGLTRAPVAEDILVLEHAVRDDDVRALAQTRESIQRLWEVCQVPDYRKISPATHAELVVTLYGFLAREGTIPVDWFARQVDQADNIEGDIDTLSSRIAHIRTWTFAANRPDWLADPFHWQETTRALEDKLSDALHERLTERFVDRRTSVLMRRLRENDTLEADVSKTGEVTVEGHTIGRLDGFTFTPDTSGAGSEAKTLAGAAQKTLAGEIDKRAGKLAQAPDDQFVLATDGVVRWQGQAVAKLIAGDDVLKPRLRIVADEHLTGASRDGVQARLDLWLKVHIEKYLGALFQLADAADLTGMARGIAFQLTEALGVLERQKVAEDVKGLDQQARAALRKYGVRFGAYHIYLPLLLKPAPRVLATQLYALKNEGPETLGLEGIERLAASGRTSIAADKDTPKALYRIAGYRVCGERAVRVDILERLADIIRPALAWRAAAPGQKPAAAFDGSGFTVTVAMTSLTGCAGEEFASILRALGYRMEKRPAPVAEPVKAEAARAPRLEGEISAEPVPAEGESGPAEGLAVDGADMAPTAEAAATDGTDDLPRTVEAVDVSPAVETASADMPAEGSADIVSAAPVAVTPEPVDPSPDATSTDAEVGVAVSASEVPAASEFVAAQDAVLTENAAAQIEGAVPSEEAASGPEAPASAAPEVAPKDDEPQLVDVWRPGRSEGPRRSRPAHHSDRRRERRPGPAQAAADPSRPSGEGAPVAADQISGEGSERPGSRDDRRPGGGRHRRPYQGSRDDRPRGDRPNPDRQSLDHAAPNRPGPEQPTSDRPAPDRPHPDRPGAGRPDRDQQRPRFGNRGGDRPPRNDRPDRGNRPDRDPDLRAQYIKGRGDRDRRDKAPDPNSPFAKLAALKERLEADAKERR